MLPPVTALTVTVDGIVTVIGVAAGSVPGTAVTLDGLKLSPTGGLYVVYA